MTTKSGEPALQPKGMPAYDPEISDMADYIHSYKINSDLAVRCV